MENRSIAAGAPPPPSEVKIRTMHSDLASMAKSGGGAPRFENVIVDGLTTEKEYVTPTHASNLATPVAVSGGLSPAPNTTVSVAPASTAYQPTSSRVTIENTSPKKDLYPIFIVIVVAILAIGGVGYFAYATFFTSAPAQQPTAPLAQSATLPSTVASITPTTTAPTSQPSSSISGNTQTNITPSSMELAAAHVSLFKKPADQVLTITLNTSNSATYRKTMLNSLATVGAASSMIEIDPKGSDGASLNISGLLSAAGISLLNSQTLANFNPDATFYVYRDKTGLWPGYILQLNPGQTQASVAASVQQIEQASNIGNVFLSTLGTPSSDGFTDSSLANLPVRVLPFTGIAAPSYFTYGWDGSYLILSTSQNGFTAAVASLQ